MKNNTCCGNKVESAFCPSCGKRQVPPGPLGDLLGFCRGKIREFEKMITRRKTWAKMHTDPEKAEKHVRLGEKAKEDMQKWKDRADALVKIFADADGN